MIVGIVGLGHIGASVARAYKEFADSTVYAQDIDQTILDLAILAKVVDAPMTPDNMGGCELIIIALYPQATRQWLHENSPHISPESMVIDCCGVKETVCEVGFKLAKEHGFTFVGGHPMAGRQYPGFKHSQPGLFKGASMVVVPDDHNNLDLLQRIKKLLSPLQLGRLTISSAQKHDAQVAFTSQLAHVVSNAFVKSPTALQCQGYSGGSFEDLIRVARLNEDMWAELFLDNRENLGRELKQLIASLTQCAQALENNNFDDLKNILAQGNACKDTVDSQCWQLR